MNADLVSYYQQRAAEYEAIYAKPERQADLAEAAGILKQIFTGKNVFEIACGTGYWTQQIAHTAASILAIDINHAVLDIATQKQYTNTKVKFELADFNTYEAGNKHESLFGGFIWSHIELQHLSLFLDTALNLVAPGGTVVFMDNSFIENSSLPIDETDEHGNTYQHRTLKDGSLHRVLKNFPSQNFLMEKLATYACDIQFISLRYYWIVSFKKPHHF